MINDGDDDINDDDDDENSDDDDDYNGDDDNDDNDDDDKSRHTVNLCSYIFFKDLTNGGKIQRRKENIKGNDIRGNKQQHSL